MIFWVTCFPEYNLLSVIVKLFSGRGIMKFNLNRDFHGEINYFPSLLHQYKMIWEWILPPLNETGMNVDLQHPFKIQQRPAQRHYFPFIC